MTLKTRVRTRKREKKKNENRGTKALRFMAKEGQRIATRDNGIALGGRKRHLPGQRDCIGGPEEASFNGQKQRVSRSATVVHRCREWS